MENQPTQQTQTSVMPAQTAAPMPQPVQNQSSSGSKLIWIILAIIIILLLVGGAYYYFANSAKNNSASLYPTPAVSTQGALQETPTPTVTPIQSSSDLNGALNQVDSTNPQAAGAGLNQNTRDSISFSQ